MIKAVDALRGSTRLLLDTNPVVYIVERNAAFYAQTWAVLTEALKQGTTLVVSPLTLIEVLAKESLPQTDLRRYVEFCTATEDIEFNSIHFDDAVAVQVGKFRRMTKLKVPDCIQLACASALTCDAILTNDAEFGARSPVRTIMVSEIDPAQ